MSAQLLVYGFGADSDFAGQLVGALERLESGGTLRVADAVFVVRDGTTGELAAIDLAGRPIDAMLTSLLEFRLDEGARRRLSARALSGGPAVAMGEALAPGTALAAVLVEHVWAAQLEDAAARTGGARLADAFVDATRIGDATDELLSAARRLTPR